MRSFIEMIKEPTVRVLCWDNSFQSEENLGISLKKRGNHGISFKGTGSHRFTGFSCQGEGNPGISFQNVDGGGRGIEKFPSRGKEIPGCSFQALARPGLVALGLQKLFCALAKNTLKIATQRKTIFLTVSPRNIY